ncbi:hypothetical protein C8J57DRAFT_1231179 [Mycena rebaudengoi]|nr:hypothetical protein C8J57DRAFT_1231179 [Mycena rebaudengoi]
MHALPVHLYADAAAAVSLFVLIFLESRSKRSLLMPMDPVPARIRIHSLLYKALPSHCPTSILWIPSADHPPGAAQYPLYLRSDPATAKLLAALAIENMTSSLYLPKSTFRAFSGHFLIPILPRLLVLAVCLPIAVNSLILFVEAQVTLVEQMVSYVSDSSIPTIVYGDLVYQSPAAQRSAVIY